MIINKLDWDSDFFNLNIGKLDIKSSDKFEMNKLPNLTKNYDLIYIFSDDEIDGLKEIDKKEIFLMENIKESNDIIHYPDSESFSLQKHSYKDLLDLGLQSGVYSRFNIDQNFNKNEYERLYTEWINQSVNNKEFAIDIIVELIQNKIVGFTTLNKKTNQLADIGLVAVNENYRGRGIGKNLIRRTVSRAKDLGFNDIQVVTQNKNKPAINLYKSTGFKSIKITNIYHYWNQ